MASLSLNSDVFDHLFPDIWSRVERFDAMETYGGMELQLPVPIG
jgi:hypothetical protein